MKDACEFIAVASWQGTRIAAWAKYLTHAEDGSLDALQESYFYWDGAALCKANVTARRARLSSQWIHDIEMLPWEGVGYFGNRPIAALLELAMSVDAARVTTRLDRGDACVVEFPLLVASGGSHTNGGSISVSVALRPDPTLICVHYRPPNGGATIRWDASEHVQDGGVLLPTKLSKTTLEAGSVVDKRDYQIDYSADAAIKPQVVLDVASSLGWIVFPGATSYVSCDSIDRSNAAIAQRVNGVVGEDRKPRGLAAIEPEEMLAALSTKNSRVSGREASPSEDVAWPAIRLDESRVPEDMLRVGQAHCAQVCIDLLAELAGGSACMKSVLAKYPQGLLTVEQVGQLASAFLVDYALLSVAPSELHLLRHPYGVFMDGGKGLLHMGIAVPQYRGEALTRLFSYPHAEMFGDPAELAARRGGPFLVLHSSDAVRVRTRRFSVWGVWSALGAAGIAICVSWWRRARRLRDA